MPSCPQKLVWAHHSAGSTSRTWGRAERKKGHALGRQQHLHHIGIVQLLSAEPIDGRQHLGGRLASDEGGGDGIDQGGLEEGLIALDIDDDGALRCAVPCG